MDYEVMRLECLKLATAQGLKGEEAIRAADLMMKFARDRPLLDKISDSAPKARAVGRDGELEKPFKDYLSKE